MEAEKKVIRVGSRKSQLALIQTEYVISLLKQFYPDKEFEIVSMSTLGDEILNKPLAKIGEKSLFTKELELALASSCVDFVVHSLKDLPTTLPDGMVIGAVISREDPRDALVLRKDLAGKSLATLEKDSVIGTSSLRRIAQILRKYPHLKIEDIRGNLNTRLKKLDEMNQYSAIVLARAGLVRMGWQNRISQVLEPEDILYAVGQGALAVECRNNDSDTIQMLSKIHCPDTLLRVVAERSFLKTLGSGCSAPVAVCSSIKNDELTLKGAVWSLTGDQMLKATNSCQIQIKNFNGLLPNEVQDENNQYEKAKLLFENPTQIIASTSNAKIDKCPVGKRKYPYDMDNEANKKFKIDLDLVKKVHSENVKCPYINSLPEDNNHDNLQIGAEFMGKCPYLETKNNLTDGDDAKVTKCPVNPEIIKMVQHNDNSNDTLKCPYFDPKFRPIIENILNSNLSVELTTPVVVECKHYCGLIGNENIDDKCLETVEELGVEVANKLIADGALVLMDEAQSKIRSLAAPNLK